jgi:TldD protein
MAGDPRYYDIRRVIGEVTQIDIDNGKVEQAGTSFFDKATVRVLGDLGWGILSVPGSKTGDEHLHPALISEAMRASAITNERVEIAQTLSRTHSVPRIGEDPRTIDIEEKVKILLDLEKSAAGNDIVSRRVTYIEKAEKIFFTDSSGSEFEYEMCRCGFSVLAVASRAGIVQMGYERDHTIRGLNIRHRHDLALESAKRASQLLDAQPAKGGRMHAILDPELGGVFAHEAVGHAAEGDLVKEGNSVLKGKIGDIIGSSKISIVDDPSLVEFGFCPIDDEGSATSRTEIITAGRMQSYLHSKETLARVGDGLPGHCRGMAGEMPIVRMSNTFIENGDSSFDEILECCRSGILLKGSRGGQVDPGRGMFQFNAEYGYLIENGECTTMVRDVSLSGEILQTLHSVSMVGNDRALHPGYCGKGGQTIPVTDGAPHLLLENAIVGGCDVC